MMTSIYLKLAFVLIIVSSLSATVLYIRHLQSAVAISVENNTKLVLAVAEQNSTLAQMKSDVKKQSEVIHEVNATAASQQSDVDALAKRFRAQSIQVSKAVKPDGTISDEDVEHFRNSINMGMSLSSRCIELATGAKLNDKERNAKSGDEFNAECPSLYISN